ncbi:hypothetical protein MMC30_009136 [Trapelia coarctata]|nr:hypothetical protein [Trapelia coarctata]
MATSKDSTGSTQGRINPTDPNHRSDVLALNGVIIKSAVDPLPANIATTSGNIYFPENESAGGGSTSLLAGQTLYTTAAHLKEHFADLTDSIVFSAAIDGVAANLYVHWYEAEGPYCLKGTCRHDFDRPEDIPQFQMHTRNIVDWGINERVEKIKMALDVILAEKVQKTHQKRKRAGESLLPHAGVSQL